MDTHARAHTHAHICYTLINTPSCIELIFYHEIRVASEERINVKKVSGVKI